MHTLFDLKQMSSASSRRLIRDLPPTEQPLNRLYHAGSQSVSNAELIAAVLQTKDALDLAHDLLQLAGGNLLRLPHLTRVQLKRPWNWASASSWLKPRRSPEFHLRRMRPTCSCMT